jgi:hypothetical protein
MAGLDPAICAGSIASSVAVDRVLVRQGGKKSRFFGKHNLLGSPGDKSPSCLRAFVVENAVLLRTVTHLGSPGMVRKP